MVNESSLQLLKDLKESGKTIDQAIKMGEDILKLQETRESLSKAIFQMSEYAQEKIREGKYDHLLGDTNGLIDQVQKDMAEEEAKMNEVEEEKEEQEVHPSQDVEDSENETIENTEE